MDILKDKFSQRKFPANERTSKLAGGKPGTRDKTLPIITKYQKGFKWLEIL